MARVQRCPARTLMAADLLQPFFGLSGAHNLDLDHLALLIEKLRLYVFLGQFGPAERAVACAA